MKPTRASTSATTLQRQSQCYAATAFSEHCFFNPGSEFRFPISCYPVLLPIRHLQSGFFANYKENCLMAGPRRLQKRGVFSGRKWKRGNSVCLFYSTCFFSPLPPLLSYFLMSRDGDEESAWPLETLSPDRDPSTTPSPSK